MICSHRLAHIAVPSQSHCCRADHLAHPAPLEMAGEGSEHHEKKPTEDPEPTPGLPRSLHSDVEDGSPSERSSEAKGSGKALTWETLQPLGPRRKRNSSEYVRRKMAEKARPAAETSANRPTDQATKESSSSERRSAFANSLKRNSKSNGSSMLSYIGGGAKQEGCWHSSARLASCCPTAASHCQ